MSASPIDHINRQSIHFNQNIFNIQVIKQEQGSSSQLEVDDPEQVDEFDHQFYVRNPGILKSQKFYKKHGNELAYNFLLEYQNMSVPFPKTIHVNLTNNCEIKELGYGLNPNRRGKLQEDDLESIVATQDNEEMQNSLFGYQPPHIVEQEKKKREKFHLRLDRKNELEVLKALRSVDENIKAFDEQNQLIKLRISSMEAKEKANSSLNQNNSSIYMVNNSINSVQEIQQRQIQKVNKNIEKLNEEEVGDVEARPKTVCQSRRGGSFQKISLNYNQIKKIQSQGQEKEEQEEEKDANPSYDWNYIKQEDYRLSLLDQINQIVKITGRPG